MTVIVRPKARADLLQIALRIAEDNPIAANRILDAAEQTFHIIGQNPKIGSQRSFRRLAGVRSRAIQGFGNYLIFYRHKPTEVEIVRVLHGMRDLPRFFRKTKQ